MRKHPAFFRPLLAHTKLMVGMRNVIVLGAGMVGVATALHLQRRGWSVVLVDRKPPGRETSYGNAGFIQSEAVRPYPMPRDLSTLAAIAMGRTNDVRYSVASLPQHLGSLLRYWWHSAPERHRRISQDYARIITQAAGEHGVLIRQSGTDNLVQRRGYHSLHRTQAALDRAAQVAETLAAEYGVQSQIIDAAQLATVEPGLNETGAGAVHWRDTWTVSDPGGLVAAYAELFLRLGGSFVHGDAATLAPAASRGWTVASDDGRLTAEAAVVALGPWSPELLRQFGYRFPMVRKRGYHRHFKGGGKLDLPVQDPAFGYVVAPMSNGLRLTTGAELGGPSMSAHPIQLERAEQAARELVDLGTPVEAEPWSGVRPCMPDMLPVVGSAAKHKGLWMNFGHGHQGFTLGPVTGRLLAELMSGEQSFTDASAFDPARY
jgi:D-amino-acid dehydrogenase